MDQWRVNCRNEISISLGDFKVHKPFYLDGFILQNSSFFFSNFKNKCK